MTDDFVARFWELAAENPRVFADCIADFLDRLAEMKEKDHDRYEGPQLDKDAWGK